MQYIPCNSALLAQKTLFLTQKGTVFQIYKSFGIWEDPPPCWEKFPNNIVFFMRAYLTFTFFLYSPAKSEYSITEFFIQQFLMPFPEALHG